MAASRKYRRNNRGQFSSSGAVVTVGRAGGFASASHRSNVANARRAKARRKLLVRRGVKAGAVAAGTVAASALLRRGVKEPPATQQLGKVVRLVKSQL